MYLPVSHTRRESAAGCPRLEAKYHLAAGNRWQAARELYRHLESSIAFSVLLNNAWHGSTRDIRRLTIRDAVAWLDDHGEVTPRERVIVFRAQRLLLAVLNRTEKTPVDLHDVFDLFADLHAIPDAADDDDDNDQFERIDA